jgi:hypothetical protein
MSEPLMLRPLRPAELAGTGEPGLSWLWDGYLARGKVTALISPPKSGKTTLLSLLLARFAHGGMLAGRTAAQARALVVSEEAASDWDVRCRHLALGHNVQFLCRPFHGARPSDDQWSALVEGLGSLHRQEALDLVVLDPLATLLPGPAEASAARLLDCLLPLQALANSGPAVWLLHHPAKGPRPDGLTARGSGALCGFADIVMEMSCIRRARSRDRCRRIFAFSRYTETPRHLILELNADGTDYLVRTDAAGSPLAQPWPLMHLLLNQTSDRLTLQQIIERWPTEGDVPDRSTLLRWLNRAARQGMVCCCGSGHRGDPFLYWLPGREPLLWPGNNATEQEKQAWRDRCAEHYRSSRQQATAPPR